MTRRLPWPLQGFNPQPHTIQTAHFNAVTDQRFFFFSRDSLTHRYSQTEAIQRAALDNAVTILEDNLAAPSISSPTAMHGTVSMTATRTVLLPEY